MSLLNFWMVFILTYHNFSIQSKDLPHGFAYMDKDLPHRYMTNSEN